MEALLSAVKYFRKKHCDTIVRIRSFSGPYFPVFGLDTEIYSVNLRIQFEYVEMRTRKTPGAEFFYVVKTAS